MPTPFTPPDQRKPRPAQADKKTLIRQYGLDTVPTVAQLRAQGFQVHVSHMRHVTKPKNRKEAKRVFLQKMIHADDLAPKGGVTEVKITPRNTAGDGFDESRAVTGAKKCASTDSYCRRVGVAFAIREALTGNPEGGLS